MKNYRIIESNTLISLSAKIAIVVSRTNYFINKNLLKGTLDILIRIGNIEKKNITIIWVPGCYEIPIVTLNLAKKKEYSAIIAIGTIIKGETSHYLYIANECSSGLSTISIKYNIPITFGILITKNTDQAINRSGMKGGNQGSKAALSALEIINVLKIISK